MCYVVGQSSSQGRGVSLQCVCVCDIACQGAAEEDGEEAGHERGEQMAGQGCPVVVAANAEAATDQGLALRLQ